MRKRRAFVGYSGPFGYDYSKYDGNPVLENVIGLLLCYDELIFLSRSLCPADMQELDYVSFADELGADATDRLSVATRQFAPIAEALDQEFSHEIFERVTPFFDVFGPVVSALTAGAEHEFAIDNHSRYIELTADLGFTGNGGDIRLAVLDYGLAAAFDPAADVVINSWAASALNAVSDASALDDGPTLVARIEAAQQIASIRPYGYLGPDGAYHESVEELRQHAMIAEFRDYLSSAAVPSGEGAALAEEITRVANRFARDQLERFVAGKSKFVTIGGPVAAGVANSLHPGAGGVVKGAISGVQWLKDWRRKGPARWALFVVDAHLRKQK